MKRPIRPRERNSLSKGAILVLSLFLSTSNGFLLTRSNAQPRRPVLGSTSALRHRQASSSSLTDSTIVPAQTTTTKASSTVGIYIHIPYCRQRCRYCDFAIVPIGPAVETETSPKNHAHDAMGESKATRGFIHMDVTYRHAIVQEISSLHKENNMPYKIQSIYFGGGTPSLAPVETIAAILDAIHKTFPFEEHVEITMEMDPGTFGKEKLQALKTMGVNRISLGVQSFDSLVLQLMGRVHRRVDIMKSISMLQKVYGKNVNYSLDFISGSPGTSLAMWSETLSMATNLEPKPRHVSIYDLQVESGTVFAKWYLQKEDTVLGINPVPKLPSPEDCAFAYRYASSYLKSKGYEHYEISSYAYNKSGNTTTTTGSNRSRHNQLYWEANSGWFAFGLGATSFVNGTRFARPRAMADYIAWVQHGEMTGDAYRALDENVSEHARLDWLTDIIMTRLRTSDGLDLDWIRDNVADGQVVVDKILAGASLGLELGLAILHYPLEEKTSLGTLRLVDPDGFLFSNTIISSIFVELGVDE